MEQLNPKIIMIVDDEEEIVSSIKLFLETEGYEVLTAKNGLEALELLRISKRPNLILLDMKMPVMDGWEFAREQLNLFTNPSPVVAITAASSAEQRAKDINACGWLSKPFSLDLLSQTIKKCES